MLSTIVELMPNAYEMEEVHAFVGSEGDHTVEIHAKDDAPFAALVFKTQSEPHVGDVSIFRILSGSIASGDEVFNATRAGAEKLNHLAVTQGRDRPEVPRLHAGDIGCVAKLRNTHTNDTLSTRAHPVRLPQITFPEPLGRQPMLRFPSGEIVTVPRHTRTEAVTSLITASAFVPHPAPADMARLALPGAALALRTPLKSMLDLAIDRLPEGPSAQDRAGARFTVAALARGRDGTTGRGLVRGADVYGLTAATVVEGATRLIRDGAARAGVLSPATAFDAADFLDALRGHGVSHHVEGVAEPAAA